MKGVTAFVLAGGRVSELGTLTASRAKSAVPFAGTYRVIDFALSNLSLSGVDRVGVLSQYRPTSLMEHVGTGEAWGLVGREREVRMQPPFQGEKGVDWYRGTADAVYQNLSFAEESDHVLIVSGDHVYQMDYNALYQEHLRTGADLTMVFKRFGWEACCRFGNVEVNGGGRAVWYQEKPKAPRSDLGSLTIYLFRREVLQRRIEEGMRGGKRLTHMHAEIIPALVADGHVRVVRFDDYWAYTRTIDDYFQASMDLLDPDSGLRLGDWAVRTNPERSGFDDQPPAHVDHAAQVTDSLLSPGCQVYGCVERSILSPGVVVGPGAVVKDSVLFHDVQVGSGARVEKVIADKRVSFRQGCQVGHGRAARASVAVPDGQRLGVTVVGKDVVVGEGAIIGANVQVGAVVGVSPDSEILDGSYIKSNGEKAWQRRW